TLEAAWFSAVAFQSMWAFGCNGILCLAGVSGGNRMITIPADVLDLDLLLGNRTVFDSVNANRRYFEMGVEHFTQAEQRWPGIFQKLITRRVEFVDFRSALDRKPEDIKTLLTIRKD